MAELHKRRLITRYLLMVLWMFTLVLLFTPPEEISRCSMLHSPPLTITVPNFSRMTYRDALKATAHDNLVILSLVDSSCRDLALNFWLTSIFAHNISNHLFIGSDDVICEWMYRRNVPCFTYTREVSVSVDGSVINSAEFMNKMYIRTRMILDALQHGFQILHSDLDVVFFKNPLRDLNFTVPGNADFAVLLDHSAYNAGFVFLRPTRGSLAVYKRVHEIGPSIPDQIALNDAIQKLRKELKFIVLDKEKYQCGKEFWEIGVRTFTGDYPCPNCVVVHNNWIVTNEAKIYRFREMNLWDYDGDNGYYTDPCRKYMTYKNTYVNGSPKTVLQQLQELSNALAISGILNRTLILPQFHGDFCTKRETMAYKRCSIISHLRLQNFQTQFPNFREHVFLSHPKVPTSVKMSSGRMNVILTPHSRTLQIGSSSTSTLWQPKDLDKGATEAEIITWFDGNQQSVLRFDSLVDAFCCFTTNEKNAEFASKIKLAFVKSPYRQQ